MHLFIANGTHQVQDFHYRIPEVKQARQQKIAVGQQVRLSGDLTKPQIDAIIDQHRKYGLIDADEIISGKGPAPLAFRVDKHIKSEEIEFLVQRNQGTLIERGKEARQNAAIVMTNQLGASARDSGTGAELEGAEVEIIEESTKGGSTGEKIEELTVIGREDRQANRGRGRSRSRNR